MIITSGSFHSFYSSPSSYQDRHFGSEWKNGFKFRQELVRGDDARHFRLVDAVDESVLAEGGVERDERHVLLHASAGRDEPLGPSFRENDHIVFGFEAQFPQASAKPLSFQVHVDKRSPFVVAQNQLENLNWVKTEALI